MDIKKIECPYCGASLKIAEGQNLAVCDHCDKAVMIDDGVLRIQKTVRNIDEFEFAKFEYEKAQVEDEKKKRKKQYVAWTICTLAIVCFLAVAEKFISEDWFLLTFIVPLPLGLLFPTGKLDGDRMGAIKVGVTFALYVVFFVVSGIFYRPSSM